MGVKPSKAFHGTPPRRLLSLKTFPRITTVAFPSRFYGRSKLQTTHPPSSTLQSLATSRFITQPVHQQDTNNIKPTIFPSACFIVSRRFQAVNCTASPRCTTHCLQESSCIYVLNMLIQIHVCCKTVAPLGVKWVESCGNIANPKPPARSRARFES